MADISNDIVEMVNVYKHPCLISEVPSHYLYHSVHLKPPAAENKQNKLSYLKDKVVASTDYKPQGRLYKTHAQTTVANRSFRKVNYTDKSFSRRSFLNLMLIILILISHPICKCRK